MDEKVTSYVKVQVDRGCNKIDDSEYISEVTK